LGHISVGAGCRDISAVIPLELIQLHAATLARQVRLKSELPASAIQIWHSDLITGGVTSYPIAPEVSFVGNLDSLKIIWDEGFQKKVRELRAEGLPNETGGILLGYFDLKLGNVYIVDALPAPTDSQGDQTGFTRGAEGLQAAVKKAEGRTAGVVSYIGEWHSHPKNSSASPSMADIYLLRHLALVLEGDGLPAVMLIVGEKDERWIIGKTAVE
jgi:integrative and conjugative element protein (TIGR02256 family)